MNPKIAYFYIPWQSMKIIWKYLTILIMKIPWTSFEHPWNSFEHPWAYNHRIGWWEHLRKALYLMVKTMVSCRFSLKPVHWYNQIILREPLKLHRDEPHLGHTRPSSCRQRSVKRRKEADITELPGPWQRRMDWFKMVWGNIYSLQD